jgi:hypothetical protein
MDDIVKVPCKKRKKPIFTEIFPIELDNNIFDVSRTHFGPPIQELEKKGFCIIIAKMCTFVKIIPNQCSIDEDLQKVQNAENRL